MWIISLNCWCTVLATLQHACSSQRVKLSISNRGKKKWQKQSVSFSWTLLKIITMWCSQWNPVYHVDQCTMHHVVIYFKKDGVCNHISLPPQARFQHCCNIWIFCNKARKSPCNGIGSTVKHKILCASLQRAVDNQILCSMQLKRTTNHP